MDVSHSVNGVPRSVQCQVNTFNYLVNEQHKQSQKLIKYGFAANYPKGVYK